MYLNNASTIAVGDEFDGFVDKNYISEFIYLIDTFDSMLPLCGFQ